MTEYQRTRKRCGVCDVWSLCYKIDSFTICSSCFGKCEHNLIMCPGCERIPIFKDSGCCLKCQQVESLLPVLIQCHRTKHGDFIEEHAIDRAVKDTIFDWNVFRIIRKFIPGKPLFQVYSE